jgi:hypothetical protein
MIKRTKEQRQNEVKTIIKKLNELHLNTSYDGIKTLFQNMKQYTTAFDKSLAKTQDLENLAHKTAFFKSRAKTNSENDDTDTDEPIIINIPCPELNIRITGVLEIDLRKKVWVKLECLNKPNEE